MKRIPAPIDNKNLLEDTFEDEMFGGFYQAYDHRDGSSTRHLIGHQLLKDERGYLKADAIVDAKWKYGDNCVHITMLAVENTDDFELVRDAIFATYRKEFKAWECEDNPNLIVEFYELKNCLNVIFYFDCE